jgi:hypothetical protein
MKYYTRLNEFYNKNNNRSQEPVFSSFLFEYIYNIEEYSAHTSICLYIILRGFYKCFDIDMKTHSNSSFIVLSFCVHNRRS